MTKTILTLCLALAACTAIADAFPSGLTPVGNSHVLRLSGAVFASPAKPSTNTTVKAVYTAGTYAVTNTILTLTTTTGFAETNAVKRLVAPNAAILVVGHPVHLVFD